MQVVITMQGQATSMDGTLSIPVHIATDTGLSFGADLSGSISGTAAAINTGIINRAKAILTANGITLTAADHIALIGGVTTKATG